MTQFSDIRVGERFTLFDRPDATTFVKHANDSKSKGFGSYRFGDIFPCWRDLRALPPYLCADWCEVYPIK